MDLALKSIEELMKHHIISNPKNSMAVCFYGTVGSMSVPRDLLEGLLPPF